jgi:pimeloyl-ACP methyl ester carboxylesterase
LRTAPPGGVARFVALDRGGHFLASEEPDRFAAEIREAFRPYRGHPATDVYECKLR